MPQCRRVQLFANRLAGVATLISIAIMMNGGSVALAASPAAQSATANPFESDFPGTAANRIDELVFGKLQQLGIEPAKSCSDAVFVRRVYLDVIGTLPSGHEVQQFILNQNPRKRSALIDQLLNRDEFADYWAMKWSDLLRVKAEFPVNLWPNAAQAYHHWIRASIKENKPYDQFVRELLTSSGSNFRVPPVNFYRAMQNRRPQGIAQTVALTFMGTRAENWPKEQLAGMAAFFSCVGYKHTAEWKEEIVFFDSDRKNPPTSGTFPNGKKVALPPDKDPRAIFADWLINPRNPWFTRNIANRVWSWLLGRGIIEQPDDIRPDNPPSNPELLAYLERELVSSHYNIKHLFRLILNSQTYQLSSIPRSNKPEAAANFAYYPLRRLDAEVLIDALNQITGTTEKYSSAIPEPFTFIPEHERSIALPDGSITSSFLELFGRPPRDTGLESERNNRISAAQRLELLNSNHILRKIRESRMVEYQASANKSPREITTGVYLGILSRYPTEQETKAVEEYVRSGKARGREAVVDLAWALINSPEFLYRH
jgi:Protein of unknown function (DUF1553)/Protein of unknown function (DUF1549)